MPFLTRDQAYEVYKLHARNSSHFVWLLDSLTFFQSMNGYTFAYLQVGDVTLLALEPLIPGAPVEYTSVHEEQFASAWSEFCVQVHPKITAFVSVYSAFAKILKKARFQSIRVGHEPWIQLDDCIPTGNSGKGVRSARNQALRAGIQVEEWQSQNILSNPERVNSLTHVLKEWRCKRLLDFSGFMNALDPFAFPESRRYFVARSAGGAVEAFLIATSIPGIQAYFLEDLVTRRNVARGTGELLTLEAMVALRQSGTRLASLGVISATTSGCEATEENHCYPQLAQLVLVSMPKLLNRFYNFGGLEVFRKRFKPHHWENIHLVVYNHEGSGYSDTGAWLKVLIALLRAFRPRLRPSWQWINQTFLRPLTTYPISLIAALISTAAFFTINHGGTLPDWALNRFAFSGAAPLSEWPLRSVTSDYLYFDRTHFLFCVLPLYFVIRWSEKTHKLNFILPFILALAVFDDFINYALIVKPYSYFDPQFFSKLISMKDVGGSLILASLIGLQFCELRKNREIIFALTIIAGVLSFALQSTHFKDLVMNMNHVVFVSFGFIAGKLKFEHERRQSRLMAKGKPPNGKCVLAGKKNQKRKRAA